MLLIRIGVTFWGVLTSGDLRSGGATTAPRTIVSDFFVTKYIDKASPGIMNAALQHNVIKEAVIEVTRYTGSGQTKSYVKFTLENCIVSSYYQTGSQNALYETLSFVFQKLTYSYTPQNPDGSSGTPIEIIYQPTKV